MSFEDTVEMYQDIKAMEAETRRERKAVRITEINNLEGQGYQARALNGDIHWRIRKTGDDHYFDYWPSTGKWRVDQKKGTLNDGRVLIDLLRKELP